MGCVPRGATRLRKARISAGGIGCGPPHASRPPAPPACGWCRRNPARRLDAGPGIRGVGLVPIARRIRRLRARARPRHLTFGVRLRGRCPAGEPLTSGLRERHRGRGMSGRDVGAVDGVPIPPSVDDRRRPRAPTTANRPRRPRGLRKRRCYSGVSSSSSFSRSSSPLISWLCWAGCRMLTSPLTV